MRRFVVAVTLSFVACAVLAHAADYPPFEDGIVVAAIKPMQILFLGPSGALERRLALPPEVRPSGPFYRLANGNWLITARGGPAVVTPDGKTVFQWKARSTSPWCEPLENGNYLIAECGSQTIEKNAEGKNVPVLHDRPRIVEVTPAGDIVRSIELELKLIRNAWAAYQMRDVKHLPNGNFLVAHKHQHLVNEYGPDGKLIKTIYKSERGSPICLWRCENGNTVVGFAEGPFAAIRKIDTTGKVVWELLPGDIPEVQLQYPTMVEKLPGGSYLVVNNHGHNKKWKGIPVFEVSPDKKILHAITDGEGLRSPIWARPALPPR